MAGARWSLQAVVAGAAFVAVAVLFSSPAAAAPPANGSWNITGTESYADVVLVMGNVTDVDGNATDYGNVTVEATGVLIFDNVTLILPFVSTFDVQGRVVLRNSTIQGEAWRFWLRGDVTLTDNTFVNATFGGVSIETNTQVIERNRWNCSNGGATINVKRAIDFRNQTLEPGCVLAYDLPIVTVNKDMEISNLVIRNTGGGTGITFNGALHTGRVKFTLHHLLINSTGGGWGIYVTAASQSTSYILHNNTFEQTGSAAIRCDSFDGGFALRDSTFTNVLRAFRMDGLPGGTVVATADNVTVAGTTDSILANDMTWVIRNSTIQGAAPQFDAGSNGHIRIYDSTDSAFLSNYPGQGGSIEHFIRLEMGTPTWQSGIAITDDLVTLFDANNVATVIVNASTWAPQEIVWWGMYPNMVRADNRALRPVVVDGLRSFNCTPASFLVSPGMALQPVECNDDAAPTILSVVPTFPRLQNSSDIAISARVDELGSGLNTLEFAVDGGGFGPVAFSPTDPRNFTIARSGLSDGSHNVTVRATDRTGNVRLVVLGPTVVDTVAPALAFDPPPPLVAAAASYTFTGDTEPLTSVSVARAGGFSNSTTSAADGRFAVGVLLEEGLNTYTITSRDAAGNAFSLFAALTVDTRPPPLVVLLDGAASATALTRDGTVTVSGSTEDDATVTVNGLPAARSGSSFSLELSLQTGRSDLTVVATDTAGNSAAFYGVAFYDDVDPEMTVQVNGADVAPGGQVVTKSGSASVAGRATDADTGVVSLIVNGDLVALDGAGGFAAVATLVEGNNAVSVSASDAVGNVVTITVTVVRDSTAPSLALAFEADGSSIVESGGVSTTAGSQAKLVLTVSESGTATFGGSGRALVAGSNAFTVSLVEGRNAFSVSFVDLAGNPAIPQSAVIDRKSTAPAVTVSAPAAGTSVDTATVELSGTTEPLSTVQVNGQNVAVSSTGVFRVTVPLTLGENSIRVNVTDRLGNTNSTAVTIVRTASGGGNGVPPASGGFGVEAIALLVVGLVAGLVGGMMMGKRGGTRSAAEGPAPSAGDALQGEPEPQAPHVQPGPKGPRGPRPPGQ